MTRERRESFRAIAAYIRATHVTLGIAAVVAPVVTLAIARADASRTIASAVFIGMVVVFGCAGLAAETFPHARLICQLRNRPWKQILDALLIATSTALLLLIPGSDGLATTAALPLALALRVVASGSFWTGVLRLATASAVCTVLSLILVQFAGTSWRPMTIVVAALVAFGIILQDSMYLLALELDDLRTLGAERAVAQERKRFAGDLHDIQGQHLQLIAVESQLVRRLIDNGRYDEADAHAQRVQDIAVQALDEMHRVVHAYRDVRLEVELANAIRVLGAAGIAVDSAASAIPPLSDTHDRLFGITIREAITNVLKHSQAARCRIEVREERHGSRDGVVIVVADTGPATPSANNSAGTGLSVLRERYAVEAGELAFSSDQGARLTAWLPINDGGTP